MNWDKFYKDYNGGEIHKEHVEFLLGQIPNRPRDNISNDNINITKSTANENMFK
jgi:hypothetical protein